MPGPEAPRSLRTRLADVDRVKMELRDGELALQRPASCRPSAQRWRLRPNRETVTLTGEEAVRAARRAAPARELQRRQRGEVQRAVGIVEDAGIPPSCSCAPRATSADAECDEAGAIPPAHGRSSAFRVATRLALEMAAHEETERRALEGELYLLEEAWKQAEEIAAIADDMFLPASVDADSRGCAPRGQHGEEPLAESLARQLHDQLGRAVHAEPRGVDAEVVVREVAPVALPVPLHVLLALLVLLGDDRAAPPPATTPSVRDRVARRARARGA